MGNNVQDTILRDPAMADFYYSVMKRAAIYWVGELFVIIGIVLIVLSRTKFKYEPIAGPVSFILGLLFVAAGIVAWVLKDKLVMLFV